MKIVGLFAGIGGIERGLRLGIGDQAEPVLLCEWWDPARVVLEAQFPEVDLHDDVQTLRDLPADVDLLSAGFPCTDLSQAGRTKGITGKASGMVAHVFEILKHRKARRMKLPDVVIENVANMLVLDKGEAMRYLVTEFESLGYRWAYRVVDSRFAGVPQRRRRVIMLASKEREPRDILLAQDAGPRPDADYRDDAFGFYWTEGLRGLGWAQDAVPTLKGGSTIGIPSQPAIWVPGGDGDSEFVKPLIEDGEAMQGFPRGWTAVETLTGSRGIGTRWKLIGNAVTVGVSQWLGGRIAADVVEGCTLHASPFATAARWPNAAHGGPDGRFAVSLSEYPTHAPYAHLSDVVDFDRAEPLSTKAMLGFSKRLLAGNLGKADGFRPAVQRRRESLLGPTLLAAV